MAPDNRGYGETDKPSGIQSYSLDILADDVANLAKKLGREKFILVGHDWGGAIGYQVCLRHRAMVDKYITCNIPHPSSFKKELVDLSFKYKVRLVLCSPATEDPRASSNYRWN